MRIRNRFVRSGFLLVLIAAVGGLAGAGARVLGSGQEALEASQEMGRRPYALLHIARYPPYLLSPSIGDCDAYASYLKTQEARIRSQLVLNAALQDPMVSRLPAITDHSDPIAWLRQNLKVVQLEDSELLRISLAEGSVSSAREQAAIINAVINAYIGDVTNFERRRLMLYLENLRKTKEGYADLLQARRRDLRRLSGMTESGEPPLAILEKADLSRLYRGLKAKQVQLRMERAEAEVLLARRKSENATSEPARKEIARLEDRLAVMTSRLKVLDEEMERKVLEDRKAADREPERQRLADEIAELGNTYRKVAAQVSALALSVEVAAPLRIQVFELATMPQARDGAIEPKRPVP